MASYWTDKNNKKWVVPEGMVHYDWESKKLVCENHYYDCYVFVSCETCALCVDNGVIEEYLQSIGVTK